MPYLYSGPEDKLCMLRGLPEKEGDRQVHAFWDGSKDRWVNHVSTRVSPDAVSTLMHTAPVDAPIPPAILKQESEESCRQCLFWELFPERGQTFILFCTGPRGLNEKSMKPWQGSTATTLGTGSSENSAEHEGEPVLWTILGTQIGRKFKKNSLFGIIPP